MVGSARCGHVVSIRKAVRPDGFTVFAASNRDRSLRPIGVLYQRNCPYLCGGHAVWIVSIRDMGLKRRLVSLGIHRASKAFDCCMCCIGPFKGGLHIIRKPILPYPSRRSNQLVGLSGKRIALEVAFDSRGSILMHTFIRMGRLPGNGQVIFCSWNRNRPSSILRYAEHIPPAVRIRPSWLLHA